MANLNLSEFTEKLFVADADHTFIWDTAASISKRVSRNSWLNSGTLTSDAPVTISQTWNNAAVAFTGFKVNATSTASANGSLFLDLQLGGVSQFKIDRNSHIFVSNANSRLDININNVPVAAFFAGGLMRTYGSLGFSDTTTFPNDLILTRDGAGQLALRNGAAAQTFRVYNTYTDASNYERAVFGYGSNQINLGSDVAGSGVHRKLNIIGAGIDFYHAGIGIRWSINTSGHFIAAADNTYDIGASGANRPRNVYVAQTVKANAFQLNGLSHVYSTVNGNIGLYDNNLTAFNLLQFGGTTNLFPAIKRSTTTIQARLADDSAFTNIQGKLTTDTAFTSGAITDTGYIVLYDSTGTAYKVACTPV